MTADGDESAAVASLERLGLSGYEAKVFIALQKLGSGTARDVSRVTDVPRSQVYGAAEQLEERGLVEVQHSNPIQYRPIDVEEAEARLEASLERERSRAFDYIESVQSEFRDGDEEREDIWTLTSRDAIDDRVVGLLRGAEESVLFAVRDEQLLTDEIEAALADRAADVPVAVLSRDARVRDRLDVHDGIFVVAPPEHLQHEERSGRLLVVDRATVLLSVVGEGAEFEGETAIWSAETGFAVILVQLIEGWLGPLADRMR